MAAVGIQPPRQGREPWHISDIAFPREPLQAGQVGPRIGLYRLLLRMRSVSQTFLTATLLLSLIWAIFKRFTTPYWLPGMKLMRIFRTSVMKERALSRPGKIGQNL